MSHSKPVVVPQNDNVAHALAGAGGGILSMILTYPLITLSTRAQVESSTTTATTADTKKTSFLSAARRIVAHEGLPGLYAGLSSALFGISVTNFVYYYWYEWARGFFERRAVAGGSSRKLTTLESMAAGAIAGCATVVLTNPIWVVNTRMTTRMNRQHDGVSDEEKAETTLPGSEGDGEEESRKETQAIPIPRSPPTTTTGTLLHLLRTEGPGALFAGVVPALVLVINPILQYTLFEQMKNAVEKRRRVTPGVAFVLGALGKLLATSVTYPYITVKSRMHIAGNSGTSGGGESGSGSGSSKKKKEGMVQALSRVVREEGYGGLYKGIGPKLTQSVLTAAFLFAFKDVLYEQTVRLRSTIQARKALHGR